MKADKPFEEIQVSDKATWRWIREGDIYVSRMTQDHMNQFKKDIEQSILAEREACAKLCESMGVYPELNVWNGGPDWYKRQKECAAAIRTRGNK